MLISKKEHDYTKEVNVVKDGRNGVSGTTLALISTIMGGGIVSIPFAFAVAGPLIGISIQVAVCVAMGISCTLYL